MKPHDDRLFETALEIPNPAERAAFLERACAGAPQRRARIEKLLAVHESAEQFFANCDPALEFAVSSNGAASRPGAPPEEEIGSCIGPYKLVEKIGEGGCGVVYMAAQEKPVRRRVALKIIKLGMDTRNVIARFEAERQALALMDHPNIARVLDAGATETGRPYFVMELVRGVKITDYCDRHHLDTRQRLELFIQLCHAIQHAHQKGIIHRDIKPSNILVMPQDGVPLPKVIDFGIAKAMQEPLTDKTLVTVCGHFIGTPAYMSPEQAEPAGVDVDTRSDIYSLGVLLYELLTGKTPFDQQELLSSGLEEMRRTLREREPHRPSTRLDTFSGRELTATALCRQSEPPQLQSQLRGDLDWIVMKALEKDRTRRYQTANAVALDVQRHLTHEPVLARPPSRFYRFRKLVRRNRGVFAAATAVTLSLLAGLAVSTELYLKERQAEREQTRLRHQAERREQVTQAALCVSQGKFHEADRRMANFTFDRPTLEGAAVLRSIGEWFALHARWKPAADYFRRLVQINQLDGANIGSLDFLGCAATLAQTGDAASLDLLRRQVVSRFPEMAYPLAAERLLKATLLLPVDGGALRSLTPLTRVISPAAPMSVGNPQTPAISWRQTPSGSIRVVSQGQAPAAERPPEPGAERESNAAKARDDFARKLKLEDIGTAQPCSLEVTNGTITIIGGGADIFGKADQFAYAYTTLQGDFDYRMRVRSVGPALDAFTRVGLMARESLASAGARQVLVAVNAGNTFQVVARMHENRDAVSEPSNPLPTAYGSNSWVRLQRVGPVFHAYYSNNGVDWTLLYQTTPGDRLFADPIYFGIAAGAHSATAVATNVVSDFGVTPTVPVNVAVTLALLEYRLGHFANAARWCHRSLAYPECSVVENSTAHIILAMACERLGQRADARANLQEGRALVRKQFADGLTIGNATDGFWSDWVSADVLLKEATALLGENSAANVARSNAPAPAPAQ